MSGGVIKACGAVHWRFLTFPGLYQRLHRMLFFVVLSIGFDTVWDGKPWFVFVFFLGLG